MDDMKPLLGEDRSPTDSLDLILPEVARPPRPKDVPALLAQALTEALLADNPDLLEFAKRESSVLAISVPNEWLNQIAEAFADAVWGEGTPYPMDGDDIYGAQRSDSPRYPEYYSYWCEFRRHGTEKPGSRNGARALPVALAKGLAAYGFAPDPKTHLPTDFNRVCSRYVAVRPIDSDVIQRAASLVFDQEALYQFSPELAAQTTVDDMMLARRPNQTVDEFLVLLEQLVRAKAAVPEQKKPAGDKRDLRLTDIAGMEEAVRWGYQLMDDLVAYRAGDISWSEVDPGVLLVGPSGVGKTTFAKGLAGSCGVELVSGSLAEWQASGHLGDLLRSMRSTFDKAREKAPCILFIDEINSFGTRSEFSGNNRDYAVQVVNSLLELLDGIQTREGVVVLGACNDDSRLDPALIRACRLDRTIEVPMPDEAALAALFRIYLGTELAHANLAPVARKAAGRTGSDVKQWVRLARRRARRAGRNLAVEDLLAEIKSLYPPITGTRLFRNAAHEAGHAIVVALDSPGSLVSVSVRASGLSGGRTTSHPSDELLEETPTAIHSMLRLLLSGRAAEQIVLGSPSGGAGGPRGSDLARATMLAVSSVACLGLAGEGALGWMGEVNEENVTQFLAMHPFIARQTQEMLTEAYASVMKTLEPRMELLRQIADLLVERETLSGEEVEALVSAFESRPANDPSNQFPAVGESDD